MTESNSLQNPTLNAITTQLRTHIANFKRSSKHLVKSKRKNENLSLNSELTLRAIKSILQIFTPYLKDMTASEPDLSAQEITLNKHFMQLLTDPNKTLTKDANIVSMDASNLTRISLLRYVHNNIDEFDHWNLVYPDSPIGNQDKEKLKQLVSTNLVQAEKRYKLGREYTKRHYYKKYASIGMGAGSGLSGFLIGAAIMGSVTASVLTAGIVGVAVLTVSTIAYLYNRHKQRKADQQLKALLQEGLEKSLEDYDPDKDETADALIHLEQSLDKVAFGSEHGVSTDKQFDALGDESMDSDASVAGQALPLQSKR